MFVALLSCQNQPGHGQATITNIYFTVKPSGDTDQRKDERTDGSVVLKVLCSDRIGSDRTTLGERGLVK